ncbi:MAG TPA: PAS-domain containing protein, partial [Candidatus Competibacteraceae bacterium]|nr:PAS-domain containing protein [Candidatus Competibacteraceae bacterium]
GLEVLQRRFALERPSPAGLSPPLARTAAELERLGGAADGVFALRARQLGLRERKAYLLSTTRAVSEQLSDEVKRFVGALQERMAQQGRSVAAAVERGKTGIVAMTLLSLLALAGGSAVVLGLTRRLGAVTRLMTRLAQGDTARATPAVERRDEIGALARAFQVFRDNAVHLKEQTRLLETVFDSMTDGLSVFDRDGRLVAWNPQYLAILRLPAEQIHAGMSLEAVQALLAREPHENRALDGRAVDMAELNLRRREQPSSFERHYAGGRVVEFRSRPMPGGGFVTLYSDLSERKAVEAQLRQAQKMEVLGQLTGGVAHDFNNLLAAVIGNLQLLESTEPLAEAGQRYTRRALAAAERGANLVHRLLAFARRQRLAPEPLRVDELIEGMLDLLEYSVGSGVAIELDLQAGDAWVHADPAQLENALLNLAINASAAMPGGGRLRFATRVQAAETAVEICVADSGSGIPEELLGRVFEPFFTTKPHGQGSGLGLSMVYGFVKQSGGDIRIDSRVGEGTTVSITLPRLPQVAAVASEAPAAAAPPRGRGELVLVVEDDPQVLGAAEDMLRALGYRTLTAASAEAALDCLMREPDIALVFSDVDLGSGMDGLALLAEAARRRPTVRGLLTTGRATAPAERDGSPPLLAKPYRLEQLAAAVRAALG